MLLRFGRTGPDLPADLSFDRDEWHAPYRKKCSGFSRLLGPLASRLSAASRTLHRHRVLPDSEGKNYLLSTAHLVCEPVKPFEFSGNLLIY